MVAPRGRAYGHTVEVVIRRATWLVRRYFAVTLLLALGAGLAAGLAMTAWLSARRAASTVDRFTAAADPPELTVTFCPPEVTSLAEEDLLRCLSYRPTTELARLRSLPEVAAAGRMAAWSALIGSTSVTITRAPCPRRLCAHPLPTSP